MELGTILFFILLMIPGVWLIFGVRRVIKQREWIAEDYRMEQERINARTLRRRITRRSALDHTGAHGEEVAPTAESMEPALQAHEAASRDWSGAQAVDSSQNLNASQTQATVESSTPAEAHSTDPFANLQINEAFEKFLIDLPVAGHRSAAARSGQSNA